MNYLKSYENEAAYLADATEARMKSGDFLLPNVSFVKDTKAVHYNKCREFPPEIGDLYINDATTNTNRFVTSTKYFNSMVSDSNITPIGIVVIPSNLIPDNRTRIMSLTTMDYNTPDTGYVEGTHYNPIFGDLPHASFLNKYSKCVTEDGTLSNTDSVYISTSPYNTPRVPLPYINNEINEIYFYNTIIDGTDFTQNCLSSYDGEVVTDLLIQNQTVDWSGTIDGENYHQGDYQAACCCRRYHTVGTNAGDWYFPAIGELGYISFNYPNIIRPIIEQLITYNKTKLTNSIFAEAIFSSTAKDIKWILGISFNVGHLTRTHYSTNITFNVLAFLKV